MCNSKIEEVNLDADIELSDTENESMETSSS